MALAQTLNVQQETIYEAVLVAMGLPVQTRSEMLLKDGKVVKLKSYDFNLNVV